MQDQEIAKECKEYVSSHALCEMITREDMAKELNYTPAHLSRRFKKATGMSLMKYAREVEMRKTAELLRGGMSVTDVVAIKGCSKNGFTRAFRAVMGINPSSVIKQDKGE